MKQLFREVEKHMYLGGVAGQWTVWRAQMHLEGVAGQWTVCRAQMVWVAIILIRKTGNTISWHHYWAMWYHG